MASLLVLVMLVFEANSLPAYIPQAGSLIAYWNWSCWTANQVSTSPIVFNPSSSIAYPEYYGLPFSGNPSHSIFAIVTLPWIAVYEREWILSVGQKYSGAHHWIYSTSYNQFGVWDGTQITSSINAPFGSTVSLTTTYDSSSGLYSLYVNGSLLQSVASTGFNFLEDKLYLKHCIESSWGGDMIEAGIWTKALTSTEVSQFSSSRFLEWSGRQKTSTNDTTTSSGNGTTCATTATSTTGSAGTQRSNKGTIATRSSSTTVIAVSCSLVVVVALGIWRRRAQNQQLLKNIAMVESKTHQADKISPSVQHGEVPLEEQFHPGSFATIPAPAYDGETVNPCEYGTNNPSSSGSGTTNIPPPAYA
eukprot:TRINITY_DN8158_c0_g1_i1.p1 TRINITY_DN8158_c0_g1~~TRINITY_DN8158_c0_g1_i1.p1  ORF type:complete len:361 (-),score=71.39 TRINITY_DN8158_c0_g1_i1:108-1190(-)